MSKNDGEYEDDFIDVDFRRRDDRGVTAFEAAAERKTEQELAVLYLASRDFAPVDADLYGSQCNEPQLCGGSDRDGAAAADSAAATDRDYRAECSAGCA